MSTQVGDRIEVGTCDLGNVFIFHLAQRGDYTDALTNDKWMVRAGNHTVATVDSEARANAIAMALVGNENVAVGMEAGPEPSPEMEKVVEATRKKVNKQ